jgi:TRAP-type mannitol/chloroaromatic compound transport system substrate-binding protein
MKAKGAEIRQWPPEMLAVFEKGWNEVVAEETAKNPNFKKVFDSYTAFRAEYAAWKEVGYLK